jgi:SAM-dependent methyltransferase
MKRTLMFAYLWFVRRAKALFYRLIVLNYRKTARLYWEVRAREISKLYGDETSDFPLLRALLDRYRPQSVLDVGCGYGRIFPLYIESKISDVLAIDISARALRLARQRFPTVRTRRARIEDLPLNKQYDLVIATRVLQHLLPENLPEVIWRLSRIARLLIYINEIGESEQADLSGAHYIFQHNYEKYFAENDWHVVETGLIPGTCQTYITFQPLAQEQETRQK